LKDIKDICFLIMSRNNSQRVKNKATKKFGNSTLFDIAVNKFIKSNLIPNEQIYLTVHGDTLLSMSNKYKKFGVNVHKRNDESVSEEASLQDIYQIHKDVDYKYFVEINICSFLLSVETIDDFIKNYLNSNYKGYFGVIEKTNYYWDEDENFLLDVQGKYMDTKKAKFLYEAAHSLYAGKLSDIKKGIHMGTFSKKNDPALYVMPEKESFDIDYDWQFKMGEKIYEK